MFNKGCHEIDMIYLNSIGGSLLALFQHVQLLTVNERDIQESLQLILGYIDFFWMSFFHICRDAIQSPYNPPCTQDNISTIDSLLALLVRGEKRPLVPS